MPLNSDQQREVERLLPLAKAVARSINPDDEDVEAEAYLALCEAVLFYNPAAWSGPVETYIQYQIRYRLSKAFRKAVAEIANRGKRLPPLPSDCRILAALERLPPDLHAVAEHRWLYVRPWKEYCKEHRCNLKAARRRLQTARNMIRLFLEELP